jgi:outer membrane immunogenic protein
MMATASFAADVPRPAVVVPVIKPFTWTGHYAGLHCGVAWGRTHSTDGEDAVTVDPLGGFCGGQVGSNWQHAGGSWVVGIEGDLGHFFMRDTAIVEAEGEDELFVAKVQYGWYGTLTGRLGFAFGHPHGPKLLYFKGGAAVAHIKNTWLEYEGGPPPEEFFEASGHRWGWVLGGGLENAVNEKWSWKLEYLAMDFGRTSTSFFNGEETETITHDNLVHTFKLGVNWRF